VIRRPTAWLILAGLLVTRFCHLDIVWVEEGYPTAAAIQLLKGKALYRDVFFDKPPLFPYFYLLWGAHTSWPLRLAGAGFVFLCCVLMYRFAAQLWTEREGLLASFLLAFYLTFGIPAAVMALAPDLLMIAPHIAAVWLAWRRQALWAGLMAGIAMLVNTKAIFVLVACLLWSGPAWPWLLLGFVLPNAAALAWFGRPYLDEVWKWGAVYSAHGFSFATGLMRTADWIGFQAALVVGFVLYLCKERSWRMLAWVLLSLAAVAAGWRFFPRYYFQLLVPMVLLSARGFVLYRRTLWRWALPVLLLVPLIRFGPRYVILGNDLIHHRPHQWSDLALGQDSEAAAGLISDRTGTLLVWGYRPDVFAWTQMEAGTRFLDSQPLTGVLADRHLTNAEVAYPELAARNREELVKTNPTYIVDGLGPLNPPLAITRYPDLRDWLSRYREIGRTRSSVVYLLNDRSSKPVASPGKP
jgi:hypothetical protein